MSEEDTWLVHCTRAPNGRWPDETECQYRDVILFGSRHDALRRPMDSLKRIILRRRLIASAITSKRSIPVVCFSAVSVTELTGRRCFRSHLGRWDYEPFGVAIRKQAALQIGIRPVIYGDPKTRDQISEKDQYRFQAVSQKNDWRKEREWRCSHSVDLHRMEPDAVRVFVADSTNLNEIPRNCRWAVGCVADMADRRDV